MGAEEQITEALRPAVQAAGLEIWDVERSGASVRVLVERAGGVDLDAISEVSAGRLRRPRPARRPRPLRAGTCSRCRAPGLERRLRYPQPFRPLRRRGDSASRLRRGPTARAACAAPWSGATDEDITVRALISGTEKPKTSVCR